MLAGFDARYNRQVLRKNSLVTRKNQEAQGFFVVLPDPAEWPLAFLDRAALIERKQRLRAILPRNSQSVLFCDHIEAAGEELFALACKNDLEGIVAKHKFGRYLEDSAQWFKIRNRKYSQWAGREKLLEREREVDPDLSIWDSCALACEEAT